MTLNRTNIALFGLVTVFSTLTLGSVAKAQPGEPVTVEGTRQVDPETQRVVRFADLNLANPEGRQALMHRVNWAINDLCDNNGAEGHTFYNPNRDCIKAAWSSAKPQLDNVIASAGSATTVAIAIVAAPQK